MGAFISVKKDIEDETNSYFQRIYNQSPSTPTLTVDEVLELLKKFQHSTNRREREIFDCMLRNLFEEYRFFPQYPDRELHITAQLFGGIMEHGLVTYMALGVALRYVLEAVRKPHGTKMYYFGITALDRFRHRLKEYPQYCQHLASIPHFREFPPHLIEYIDNGSRGVEPPNRPHGPVLPQVTTAAKTTTPTTPTTTVAGKTTSTAAPMSGRPSIANATNIDTLLVASEKDVLIVDPPESVQDKVSFIFNNLSQLNLTQKCEELRDIVGEEHWSWVAQYLVMKRASIEPNFHTLYSNFLDTLKLSELSRLVISETFRNIKVLLRSDKGIANFSDRTLLKNLGHWLGLLMLSKNRPILQVIIYLEIDCRFC
jgi:CCR4-NOT transcription complex subunit 1